MLLGYTLAPLLLCTTAAGGATGRRPAELKIAWVGNSYTYYHDLPLLLEFIPGAGELISATEAAKYLAEARAAERDGNIVQANAAWTAFALAAAAPSPSSARPSSCSVMSVS